MPVSAFVQVRLVCRRGDDELLGLLDSENCLGMSEIEGIAHLYWKDDSWDASERARLESALRRIGEDPQAAILDVSEILERDWNEAWVKQLQPMRAADRIWIRQSWNRAPAEPGDIELVIDPRRAFGSGYHVTTRMVLEFLEKGLRGGESVLDLGTGSGILAMAALRLGAARALALDNDPEALECARQNAVWNGFGRELDLRLDPVEQAPEGGFDWVVANLDRNALLRMAGAIIGKTRPGGRCVISGLQPEDSSDIRGAFGALGGRVLCRVLREGWEAMEIEKPRET